jgi:hypothetical protein
MSLLMAILLWIKEINKSPLLINFNLILFSLQSSIKMTFGTFNLSLLGQRGLKMMILQKLLQIFNSFLALVHQEAKINLKFQLFKISQRLRVIIYLKIKIVSKLINFCKILKMRNRNRKITNHRLIPKRI